MDCSHLVSFEDNFDVTSE